MQILFRQRLLCCLAGAAIALGGCSVREPAADDRSPSRDTTPVEFREADLPDQEVDTRFETIMAGLELPQTTGLAVTRPSDTVETTADSYYITGVSDPGQPLLVDGEPVEGRGALGSFGIYLELEPGANTVTLSQGDTSETVVITQVEETAHGTTDTLTELRPAYDVAFRAGEGYTLSCVAPSGAAVSVEVGGVTVELEQLAATALPDIPATFAGTLDIAGIEGTQLLGDVTYTLVHDGSASTHTATGKLYAVGAGDDLLVRARDISSATFVDPADDEVFFTTLKQGALARVSEIGDSMYRLDFGAWVKKDAVEPVTDNLSIQNVVSGATFTAGERVEVMALQGTAAAPYRADWEDDGLTLTFYHTRGADTLSVEGSALFSAVTATETDEGTALRFAFLRSDILWGYLVEYTDSAILLSFAPRPVLAAGDRPLQGLRIALDPGHGGSDGGAAGVALDEGPHEKDVNRATALATGRYLEALGAEVLFLREGDERVELNDRLALTQSARADLMISLHANSVSYSRDGTGPSGVEVYYYEDASAALAQQLQRAVCARTGRKNREARQGYYKVTLNSYTPSAMVEMGFLTNPVEYDDLRSGEGIYNTAAAVAQAVVDLLDEDSGAGAVAATDIT